MQSPADLLRAAKALVRDPQAELRIESGPCAALALMQAEGGFSLQLDATATLLARAIPCADDVFAIGHWFDDRTRTLEDVHAAFDRAIALAETKA